MMVPLVDHVHRHIVEEARRIASRTNSTISHIYRQANHQTADCLARLGYQQEEELIVVTSRVSFATCEFVIADAMGLGHIRT